MLILYIIGFLFHFYFVSLMSLTRNFYFVNTNDMTKMLRSL